MEVKSITKAKEEAQANLDMWKYALGFTPMAIVKCAIELQIADVLESHGGAMTLLELSTALGCSPPTLHRIMRYLNHRGFFKRVPTSQEDSSSISYEQTTLSRMLMKNSENSMASLVMLESSHVMLGPWHNLRARALTNGASAFVSANGEELWKYASENPAHSKLINDGLACRARVDILAIIDQYPEAFKGIGSLVDVGGGDGTSLHTLVKACPWIRGTNFDLPHVTSMAPNYVGIEHVGGDMFERVPKADAAFLMSVLHDWNDEECIHILRNCLEAIPKDTGKVIIAEAVIEEGEKENEYSDVRLALDMVMLAHTETGKERTSKEWEYVVKAAGFSRFKVKLIEAIPAVIEAYP
ncbi:hypothetical protein RD792_002220 [Penstemon davidsonii]|uniref:O-methyltransferase n=1 Tax=Penstemon davidsonii TaxID=160366 RepID=A0ABR0DRB5_9LAMI|nr:hypothetical protein RD792_002220 [Penstemon davidsonii]